MPKTNIKHLKPTALLTLTVGAALLAGTLASSAFAQTAQAQDMPTPAQVAAQKAATLNALKAAEPQGQSTQMQLGANAARANAAQAANGTTGANNVSKNDFLNLARPGGSPQALAGITPNKGLQADLMIFVSLSMPEQMLQQYAVQAKRFGAVLMMRGFVNDKLSETREVLARLNKSGAQWEISPEPFVHFKIEKVPAIVMATAESASITEDGCAKPETYTTVFGDLSVASALDKIAVRGQKTISDMAKAKLLADKQAGAKS
jgi:type-F conjugative transfer system pilin assembly protein TrbC